MPLSLFDLSIRPTVLLFQKSSAAAQSVADAAVERGRVMNLVAGVLNSTICAVNYLQMLELRNRWAPDSAQTGNLNFHWRCMMAPLTVIDYIVVHELAHVLVPDHSSAFWSEVDKVLPDYRERQRWLREHGAGMDL